MKTAGFHFPSFFRKALPALAVSAGLLSAAGSQALASQSLREIRAQEAEERALEREAAASTGWGGSHPWWSSIGARQRTGRMASASPIHATAR